MSLRKNLNNEAEIQKRIRAIELCGKNCGPHHYIPIEWIERNDEIKNIKVKQVTRFICTTCFVNISTTTLLQNYENVSCED